MDGDLQYKAWKDWTVVGLRFLALIFVCLIVLIPRIQEGTASSSNADVLTTFIVGLFANIVLIALIFVPPAHPVLAPVIIIGDWAMAAAFTAFTQTNPTLLVVAVGLLIFISALRLGLAWGSASVVGILIATVVTIGLTAGSGKFGPAVSAQSHQLVELAVFAIVSIIWSFVLQHESTAQRAELAKMHQSKAAQLSDMRERTRAIYEMAEALSATLNYEKILQAALKAGWLGLREPDRRGKERLVSAVLLFRTGDGSLQVVTGRGLARTDEARSTPGKDGIIAEAIKKCEPVFSENAKKDPELQMFVAFQGLRSVLCIPLRAGFDTYGVLLYGSDKAEAFTPEHTELLTAIGTQATVALQNSVLYQNLLDERDRIVEVEEDARKKLARDLHDGPTQNVAAIAMRMNIIQRMLERTPDEVPGELKKVEELARKTTKEIRHMLFTLRPLVLENQGLTAALEQLADKMKETHNQAVAVRVSKEAEKSLDSHQQGVIFYIIEEAVGNARKHAAAELISTVVTRQDDVVVVKIIDNGVGFDVSAVSANYDQRGSLGMVNLRERTELLGGSLRIDSAEGQGTTITVVVPIRESPTGAQSKQRQLVSGAATKLGAAAIERIRAAQEEDSL